MIFLMIAGLLLCIISVSSVTALEPKISKSVASLEKKNLSPTSYTLTKGVGTRLFDGTEIIQSPEVISTALKNMKSGVFLNDGDEEPEDQGGPHGEPYWDWTLRQFADYLEANSSRTIQYSLMRTNGDYILISEGVLGYSPSIDLITGDKYAKYYFSCPVYPDCGLWRHGTGHYRLIIDPELNQLIIQEFYSSSSSPSPDWEETIMIEHIHSQIASNNAFPNHFYGRTYSDPPIVLLTLWPYPLPESTTE
ncbi:hypothetical protein DLD82_08325 [Methanospirillum stamsii]|uniref:Uncharacterized protein n=2 Tax=Methanospirillum stamsii TaxID=1277351 RepID=A0A2V2N7F6_9EURY|nr:hypothetical protein DLD82_08325 [Methanospirillum stamsii]